MHAVIAAAIKWGKYTNDKSTSEEAEHTVPPRLTLVPEGQDAMQEPW